MECVIIGGGAAGLTAALTCRQLWPQKSVTLIDSEREIGYYRPLLSPFIAGELEEEKLFFWQSAEDSRLTIRTEVKVERLDRANQRLHLENKEKLEYERLILAHGGYPLIPRICARNSCRGIFPVRNLTTAREIREWLPSHREIVILGGGLVGVKTAVYLAHSGLAVTLVEQKNYLLPRALSPEAASLTEKHLHQMGIRFFLGCSVEDIQIEKGLLKAVQVSAQWLPCQTLLVAAGSTPNMEFLEDSGLLENGELVVSPTLQTRDEKIYAAGDAVTISTSSEEKFTPWTWPQAVSQGKLAAANLYKSAPIALNVLTRVNSINLYGLSLVVLGAPMPELEVISYSNLTEGVLRELFLLDDRIVGGALVGDISGAGPLHAMINSGCKIDKTDYDLLKPRGRSLSQFSWNYIRQKQQARFLFFKE